MRVGLGYVQKGFSSRLYGRVPSSKIKGRGNLTGRLTPCLTARLTGYLPRDLTNRGFERSVNPWKLFVSRFRRPICRHAIRRQVFGHCK